MNVRRLTVASRRENISPEAKGGNGTVVEIDGGGKEGDEERVSARNTAHTARGNIS